MSIKREWSIYSATLKKKKTGVERSACNDMADMEISRSCVFKQQ